MQKLVALRIGFGFCRVLFTKMGAKKEGRGKFKHWSPKVLFKYVANKVYEGLIYMSLFPF